MIALGKETFFRDKFGHLSTKRVCGVLGFLAGLALGIMSGFHWYQIDTQLILGILGISAGLLGFTTFESTPGIKNFTTQPYLDQPHLNQPQV